ncbi:MAG TPA: FtsX-like permease family protein, partial [Chryseosolibacter sp.]|nr:FtsX-like permease family protein [Chryseosolibacter sp.]
SSIVFDALLPLNDLLSQRQYIEDNGWGWKNFATYVQVQPGTDLVALQSKMPAFLSRYVEDKQEIGFQSLYDIHTQPGLAFDSPDRISRNKISFFVVIAWFILSIAWINYINLSTARAMERAREVGIKKVIGARKLQLILQFMMESAAVNVIAIAAALMLATAFLPFFRDIVQKNISFGFSDPGFWAFLGGIAVIGSIASGLYPAFILSSFNVNAVLKGGVHGRAGKYSLRHGLVVFQFACSLILIAMTVVVYRQVAFMATEVSWGKMDQVLIVKAPRIIEDEHRNPRALAFKQEIKNLSAVKNVSSSAGVPGGGYTFTTVMRKSGTDADDTQSGNVIWVDPDFIKTYEIELLSGKGWEDENDFTESAVIINETALRNFGIENPDVALHEQIIFENDTFRIAGVMKDEHWNSLKHANVPILFLPHQVVAHTFSIRLQTTDFKGTVARVEALFKKTFPGNPFEFYFLDEFFNRQYKDDQRFGKIFSAFTLFAILISCMGLVGLTAFSITRKLKEISIRKVLGASTGKIILLLLSETFVLIGVASVISLPIMWYAANSWLESFAFRMRLTADVFVLPIVLLGVLCVIAVIGNVVRGARSNPANILKSE